MKNYLISFYLMLLSVYVFSQNKFPFKWDLDPCYEDVEHNLRINNEKVNDNDEIADIGDTLTYEILFPKDTSNLYEYRVSYQVWLRAGNQGIGRRSGGFLGYDHSLKFSVIITPEIHNQWLNGQDEAKIFIEIGDYQFKDKTGNIGSMRGDGFVRPCCKMLTFFIKDMKDTSTK